MKILVTGAAGFIGYHFCKDLLEMSCFEVYGIDNLDPFYDIKIKKENLLELSKYSNFEYNQIDITTDRLNSIKIKPDVVIHLAAKAGVRPSIDNSEEYAKTNIQGTVNLLEWCVKKEVKNFVFGSSSSVYGNSDKEKFSESDDTNNPISPYAATKKACESICYTYHHLYGISMSVLRFFTVYGPKQRPDLAIHKFTKKILNNEYIELYGDGQTERDYTYVLDITHGICKAMMYCLKHKVFEVFNLGSSNPIKLSRLINILSEKLGKDVNIHKIPLQPGDVLRTSSDISKAEKILGYETEYNIESGISEFVKWAKEYYKV